VKLVPFPLPERYYHYSRYLREIFGTPVQRISLDAGFSCPTRDGTLGTEGCLYCNNESFTRGRTQSLPSIREQLQTALQHRSDKQKARHFLAYFQAYTNTYASVVQLEKLYREALDFPEICGLCIGTRPDCLSPEIIALLQDLRRQTYISVEIGIESVYDKTLLWARRGHDFSSSRQAIDCLKAAGLHVAGHYILGFPTETRSEQLQAAEILNQLGLDAIKLHHLHIVRETPLAHFYDQTPFAVFSANEWILMVCDFLERLNPGIVIQRMVGEARLNTLVAPRWQIPKSQILRDIMLEFEARDSYQGMRADIA
jgi:radical SAM protein (TIGR01212 family)